jgi:hypothetical protein
VNPLENAAPNELIIKIRKPLYASFVALAELKQMKDDLENCAAQILEAAIIEHRAKQIHHEMRGRPPKEKTQFITVVGDDNHKRKLSAAMIQQILFVHATERLNGRELGQRFGVSRTSVERILTANAQAAHTPMSTGSNGKCRGQNLPCTLSTPTQKEQSHD